MSKYFIEFKNKTGLGQYMTFCVYQQMDDAGYSDSVAWLFTTIPGGSSSTVSWKLDKYMVALADYRLKDQFGTYHNKQTASAELDEKVEPYTIKITNNSTASANCGVGMWGGTTGFVRNLHRSSTASFKFEPKYFIGVFDTEIHRGQVIEDNALASKLISFPPEKNLAIITAMSENGSIFLTVDFSERSSNPYFSSFADFCEKLYEIIFIVPISCVKNCFTSIWEIFGSNKKKIYCHGNCIDNYGGIDK
ncbi:7658_t:CDS:2 [Gigaspora rosea]|nr:7658_t:CDS:2 [Gigaspora rosea]